MERTEFYFSSLFVLSNVIVLYNLFVENLLCFFDLARRADHPIVSIHSSFFQLMHVVKIYPMRLFFFADAQRYDSVVYGLLLS